MILPILETKRLTLRKIKLEDAEAMYQYASKDDVTKHVLWDSHRSIETTKQFVQMMIDKYEEGNFAWAIMLKETKEFIGTIDFVTYNEAEKIAEIGYALSDRHWGKGYVSEATKALLDFGFNELQLVRIQARCFADNIGSERVMQKVGMTYEGTMRKAKFAKGKHHDIKMYAILREDIGL